MCNEVTGFGLYIQAVSISLAFASSLASYFGMHLLDGLKDNPYAFIVTVALITITSVIIFTYFIVKFKEIKHSGPSTEYRLLKNITRYI